MKMYIMKRHLIWILFRLILISLLNISLTSLAEEGKWTKKANMPTPRALLSTSVVNGKIYAIGGSDRNITLSIVEEYDPGFAGEAEGIEAKGKLDTSWGKIKSKY